MKGDLKSQTKKSTHGGRRPGAGRKPKVELLAGPIERIKADIEELAPLVGPSLRELVEGIWVEETDRKGNHRVYQQPPNLGAIVEVINRTLGKVTEKHEVTGELNLLLGAVGEIKQRAGN